MERHPSGERSFSSTVRRGIVVGLLAVAVVEVIDCTGTLIAERVWEPGTFGSPGMELIKFAFVLLLASIALVPLVMIVAATAGRFVRTGGPGAPVPFVVGWAMAGGLCFALFARNQTALSAMYGAFELGAIASVVGWREGPSGGVAAHARPPMLRPAILLPLIVLLTGWRSVEPPVEGTALGRSWYISEPIQHGFAIEAGRASSRRLYRHVGLGYYPIAGGIDSWFSTESDCVLYSDRDTWAVCGDRVPVKVGAESDPRWHWLTNSWGSTVAPGRESDVADAVATALVQPLRGHGR